MSDINGAAIDIDDEFYYAMSLGRVAVMKKYKCVDYVIAGSEVRVYAELIASPINWDSRAIGRVSTLHGELFKQRAVLA